MNAGLDCVSMIVAVDISLRPLSPAGKKILDELESDYGVRARETRNGGERLYVITAPNMADHYERHLAGYNADWRSHVAIAVHH